MTQETLKHLLRKYLRNELSEEEFQRMWTTLGNPAFRDTWTAFMQDIWDNPAYRQQADETAKQAALQQLLPLIQQRPRPFLRRHMRWAAAACIAVLLGGLFFLMRQNRPAVQLAKEQQAVQPVVKAGGNKAVLTLADGTTIELDSASDGMLTKQGNTKVMKLANGKIEYQTAGNLSSEILYNTMRTPRGGQYRITLPDGTQAWLNAASSITYPTAFTGAERIVKVTGEVYFEVAKMQHNTPFRVEILSGAGLQKGEVTVLGTHFNINAYDNESSVKATLLEGAVKVRRAGEAYVTLRPGQQAKISQTMEVLQPEDLEAVTAWKNGYFIFNQTDIQAMMRQAERWYNITVEYPKGVPADLFSGSLPRNVNLQQFLEILVYSDVDAKINERTVIITP